MSQSEDSPIMNPELYLNECYETRREAWDVAQDSVTAWLTRISRELLEDSDGMRLVVGSGRIKDQDRALLKLKLKIEQDGDLALDSARKVEQIVRDIVGVKVLCKSTRDQALIFDHLKQSGNHHGIRVVESKDYVSAPKASGYRAVHVLCEVDVPGHPDAVTVEIQIKTRAQDAWGELTHEDLYKPEGGLRPSRLHQSVAKTMADLLNLVDCLADDLATDVEGTFIHAAESEESDTRTVTVQTSGPRYALAEDEDDKRGLIPAHAVRDLAGVKGLIDVDNYLEPGDEIDVKVVDNEEGVFYYPVALPERPS